MRVLQLKVGFCECCQYRFPVIVCFHKSDALCDLVLFVQFKKVRNAHGFLVITEGIEVN